jgi:hypothetical protein
MVFSFSLEKATNMEPIIPPNAKRDRETPGQPKTEAPPKEVKRIVKSEAVQRKKPLGKRLMETFVGGDDARSVGQYLVQDVLVPAFKDTIVDMVQEGIERMVRGESSSRRSTRNRPGQSTHVNYNSMSRQTRPIREEPRRELSRRDRATHNFGQIEIDTKGEADEVIDYLFHLISTYEVATVADVYEMVGLSGNFTDEKYGWTDVRGARAVRIRGGKYILDLPDPQPLD